jgi:hypothetical protein
MESGVFGCPFVFSFMRQRTDRGSIKLEWTQAAIDHPEREVVQADGRIRCWAAVPEAEGKYLRVILLPDRETVHNPDCAGIGW